MKCFLKYFWNSDWVFKKVVFNQYDQNFNVVSITSPELFKLKILWKKLWYHNYATNDVTNKIYHMTQIIFHIWSHYQSLVTLPFLWEKLSYRQKKNKYVCNLTIPVKKYQPYIFFTRICKKILKIFYFLKTF